MNWQLCHAQLWLFNKKWEELLMKKSASLSIFGILTLLLGVGCSKTETTYDLAVDYDKFNLGGKVHPTPNPGIEAKNFKNYHTTVVAQNGQMGTKKVLVRLVKFNEKITIGEWIKKFDQGKWRHATRAELEAFIDHYSDVRYLYTICAFGTIRYGLRYNDDGIEEIRESEKYVLLFDKFVWVESTDEESGKPVALVLFGYDIIASVQEQDTASFCGKKDARVLLVSEID